MIRAAVRVGVLFSGGKDSCMAYYRARGYHDVVCLITLVSKNRESYMFHVPNIDVTRFQAEAMGVPLLQKITEGEREKELDDLRDVLALAKDRFCIEGVVTGAIMSVYQASRIQKVCHQLKLWCFNPLWLSDQIELLKEILEVGLVVIVSGVFAFPLDDRYLGKVIDQKVVEDLTMFKCRYGVNPAGEGGEMETTVVDAPFFRKRIEVTRYQVEYKSYSGTYSILEARLVDK
jgi:ABC transporter with metal-binding/Fe-S-binding domain ATP-binding protein